jgi:DNA-binding IscR family transcriptional regulator
LVETRKGAGFGSRLSRSPGRINLAQVFRAVEADEPFTMPRAKPNAECPVGHCIQRALHGIFSSTQRALERELSKTTLADVLAVVWHCCEQRGVDGH